MNFTAGNGVQGLRASKCERRGNVVGTGSDRSWYWTFVLALGMAFLNVAPAKAQAPTTRSNRYAKCERDAGKNALETITFSRPSNLGTATA